MQPMLEGTNPIWRRLGVLSKYPPPYLPRLQPNSGLPQFGALKYSAEVGNIRLRLEDREGAL